QPLLRGHALVEWSSGKRIYRFDQVIVIANEGSADFETIDDFGNTLLRFGFADGKIRLGKLLSLPLSRDEFIAYLLYRVPERDDRAISVNADGRVIGVEKKSKSQNKRYKISFRDFKKRGNILYPKTIEMTSRKTSLKITWKNAELNF
ncbi:MAG: hypothetical protein HYU99_08065, partial [Deltaproteobacteria bacterium]|nr:hypothetical protein [Deltaproteobacteria bacterium]